MTPIYNADTLRKVSTDARLAEYNRIKNNYVPAALCKVSEANFEFLEVVGVADGGLDFVHHLKGGPLVGLVDDDDGAI